MLAKYFLTGAVFRAPRMADITLLLHGLPVCFQVQFKVLIMTFKALKWHRTRPPDKNHILPLRLGCPTWVCREDLLWIPSVKEL